MVVFRHVVCLRRLFLLMFRAQDNAFWLSIVLGNAMILLGYGFVWLGFATFHGIRIRLPLVPLGAVVWLAACVMSDEFRSSFNTRAIVLASIGAVYAGLSARIAYQIYKTERLRRPGSPMSFTRFICDFPGRAPRSA